MRATIGSVELNYQTSGLGDAPWVTLIPGITNDSMFWDLQCSALDSEFRVLRFDPRGHGVSTAPSCDYDLDDLMADIVGLWDAVGIERSHVVGLGFGGSLAIGLSIERAERVLSLTACCCRAVMTDDFILAWNDRADQVAEHGVASVVDATVARWFTDGFADGHHDRMASVRAMAGRTSANGYVGHARAFATIDWSRDLHRIVAPTLLISASGDSGGGRADVMQRMAEEIPNAQHETVPDAGHLCNIENPDDFNRVLIGFLRRISQNRRLAPIAPDSLDVEQRRLYDTILGGPRASGPQRQPLTTDDGSLLGPFNSMLLSPPVGMAVQALGAALRFGTTLSHRERELAVLLVAASWGSDFERRAHEAIARSVGLTDDEIAAVSAGGSPQLGDLREQTVVDVVKRLLSEWNLDDSTYASIVESLGEPTLYELTTIVGHYSLLALHLRVFNGESAT